MSAKVNEATKTSRVNNAPPSGTLYTAARPAPAPHASNNRRWAKARRPESRPIAEAGADLPRRSFAPQRRPHDDGHDLQHGINRGRADWKRRVRIAEATGP